MATATKIQTEPWQTPNYVRLKMPPRPRQEGFQAAPGLALSEVEPEVLAGLCDDFRDEIFKKAGKTDPQARCILCGTDRKRTICVACTRRMDALA